MFDNSFELGGQYTLTVKDENGKLKSETTFQNLITNTGLDRIGTGDPSIYFGGGVQVGVSNAVPAFTDTALGNYVAGAGTGGVAPDASWDAANNRYAMTLQATFEKGAAAGNLAEVGLTDRAEKDSALLFSRALIKDASGNPTVLTVLATDVLTVTYVLYMYPVMTVQTQTVTISGTSYKVTSRPYRVVDGITQSGIAYSQYQTYAFDDAALVDPSTGSVSAYRNPGIAGEFANYSAGTYRRDFTYSAGVDDWNPNNPGDLLRIVITNSGLGKYQYLFTPGLAKDNTKSLTLTFRITWSRKT